MFVLDSSVTIAAMFPDEQTPRAREIVASLRAARAHVPAIWWVEVVNVLVQSERRGRLSGAEAVEVLRLAGELPIVAAGPPDSAEASRLGWLSRLLDLTAYDASYLDLAHRLGLPLATFDVKLANAATLLGVKVL